MYYDINAVIYTFNALQSPWKISHSSLTDEKKFVLCEFKLGLKLYLSCLCRCHAVISVAFYGTAIYLESTVFYKVSTRFTLCCVLLWLDISWWRHQMETFSALLAVCAENSPVPVNSPHKGQWRGGLMFSLIRTRINGWVNNREAGDLRRHQAHCDVIVMWIAWIHQDKLYKRIKTKLNKQWSFWMRCNERCVKFFFLTICGGCLCQGNHVGIHPHILIFLLQNTYLAMFVLFSTT